MPGCCSMQPGEKISSRNNVDLARKATAVIEALDCVVENIEAYIDITSCLVLPYNIWD